MEDYTIYTQEGRACPWCDKAKDLLTERGLNWHAFPLGRAGLLSMAENNNHNSVPMIFHGDKFIGGFSELEASFV